MIPKNNPTAAELKAVRKGRVLSEVEQERFLKFLSRGYTNAAIISKMRVSNSTLTMTRALDANFADKLKKVQQERSEYIEATAYSLALGATEQVEMIYTARLNREGDPIKDENGNPSVVLKEKRVKKIPPNWETVKFLLQTYMPEKYCLKHLQAETPMHTLEQIQHQLANKVRQIEGRMKETSGV